VLTRHAQCELLPTNILDPIKYCLHPSPNYLILSHQPVTHPTSALHSPLSLSPSSITSQLVELFSVGCSDQEAAQELRALVGPTIAWARSSQRQAGRGGVQTAPAPTPQSTYGNSSYNSSGTRSSYCPTPRDGPKDTGRAGPSQDDVTELSLGEGSHLSAIGVTDITALVDCSSYDGLRTLDLSIPVGLKGNIEHVLSQHNIKCS
jgi:hypothetical protein